MRISVLGLGRMGRAVAGRLLAGGHEVVVWNRTPGQAPELVDRGAREAATIAAAVAGVALAMTSLANDEAVRQVACGEGGVHDSIDADSVYVDLSTISPALSADLDGRFSRFAAMPILGSPIAVASGQATYLLGATAAVAAAVDPLFPSLAEKVRHYVRPPLASTAKLAVNLLLLDELVALTESITVGRVGGLSDDQLRDLLGESPMLPPGLKNRFEGVITAAQDPWWTTVLGAKDAGLAVALVAEAGGQLPLTATARDLYLKAAERGYSAADIAAVAHVYRL
jgi:3-hydroxyisobutyrate dehydrogenase-like beta-hydroxyacid dehydrogenase